ncbi:MAG: very short patch repair endonuclease [Caulobacteraceae bacterium]|nr:very short patch repair endonuclease [Caulobacteraceae bacterium]
MSRIRNRDTKPELQLRRALHAAGFRYRLHDRRLPGSPDLVLPSRTAVVFVHGCFWHGHDCALGVIPNTRTEFWETKIRANKARDAAAETSLLEAGWRVLTVWECALRGRRRLQLQEIVSRASDFLLSKDAALSIQGDEP